MGSASPNKASRSTERGAVRTPWTPGEENCPGGAHRNPRPHPGERPGGGPSPARLQRPSSRLRKGAMSPPLPARVEASHRFQAANRRCLRGMLGQGPCGGGWRPERRRKSRAAYPANWESSGRGAAAARKSGSPSGVSTQSRGPGRRGHPSASRKAREEKRPRPKRRISSSPRRLRGERETPAAEGSLPQESPGPKAGCTSIQEDGLSDTAPA